MDPLSFSPLPQTSAGDNRKEHSIIWLELPQLDAIYSSKMRKKQTWPSLGTLCLSCCHLGSGLGHSGLAAVSWKSSFAMRWWHLFPHPSSHPPEPQESLTLKTTKRLNSCLWNPSSFQKPDPKTMELVEKRGTTYPCFHPGAQCGHCAELQVPRCPHWQLG